MASVHGCSLHAKGSRLKVGKQGMVGYVAATGQMRYAPDVRLDPYYVACEESTLSEVAIPLLVDGKLVGVFSASHPELDAFTRDHLRWLQALCEHVAVAVNNAARFQYERDERQRMSFEEREARVIQQALLPKSSPYIPGFAISGVVDSRGRRGRRLVRLHLLRRRLLGTGSRRCFWKRHGGGAVDVRHPRHVAFPGADLHRSGSSANSAESPAGGGFPLRPFCHHAIAGSSESDLTRTLTFSSAGHLRPLLVDQDWRRALLDSERGMPLGLGSGEFSESQVHLSEGSRLVFYSDGITEATGGSDSDEEYGAERMRDHVLKPDAMRGELFSPTFVPSPTAIGHCTTTRQ